jgi:hypothetical protein
MAPIKLPMRNVIPRPKAGGDIFTPGLFFTKPEAGMTSKSMMEELPLQEGKGSDL